MPLGRPSSDVNHSDVPGFGLVGYELGADLQAALAVGFAWIGPLRGML
jgi:hypothetical protein